MKHFFTEKMFHLSIAWGLWVVEAAVSGKSCPGKLDDKMKQVWCLTCAVWSLTQKPHLAGKKTIVKLYNKLTHLFLSQYQKQYSIVIIAIISTHVKLKSCQSCCVVFKKKQHLQQPFMKTQKSRTYKINYAIRSKCSFDNERSSFF